MTLSIAPERTITAETELLLRQGVPLVIEFTSSRAKQRPLAARAGGIEIQGGRLPVRAVDIDRHPDLRRRFHINLLPTFVIMQDLNEVARFIGPHSRPQGASLEAPGFRCLFPGQKDSPSRSDDRPATTTATGTCTSSPPRGASRGV